MWGDPGSNLERSGKHDQREYLSGTAQVGTDEQEPHKRPFGEVEAAHHVKGRNQQSLGGRCGRDQRKEDVLTQGGLELGSVFL